MNKAIVVSLLLAATCVRAEPTLADFHATQGQSAKQQAADAAQCGRWAAGQSAWLRPAAAEDAADRDLHVLEQAIPDWSAIDRARERAAQSELGRAQRSEAYARLLAVCMEVRGYAQK